MGATQRMAAVAAVAHSRHYYNRTAPEVQPTDSSPNNINFILASATLCGVLVMICAACWRRKSSYSKPVVDVGVCRGVYTVSADSRLSQVQMDLPGPPPAYETIVDTPIDHNKVSPTLEEVVTEPRPSLCRASAHRDSELPSYEAAVMLRDTKL